MYVRVFSRVWTLMASRQGFPRSTFCTTNEWNLLLHVFGAGQWKNFVTPQTFLDATHVCQTEGGNLVSISSQLDQNALMELAAFFFADPFHLGLEATDGEVSACVHVPSSAYHVHHVMYDSIFRVWTFVFAWMCNPNVVCKGMDAVVNLSS